MKRLSLIVAVAGLVSCAALPETPATQQLVCVSFSHTLNTKALPDAIAASMPASLPITLTSEDTGEVYKTETGKAVILPTGAYQVTGANKPRHTAEVIGSSVYLSAEPALSVSQRVEVVAGVEDYPLAAGVRSCILAVDPAEVKAWSVSCNGETRPVPFSVGGGVWWTYCTGDTASRLLRTEVTPTDAQHVTTTFSLTTSAAVASQTEGARVIVPGRWYWLHPDEHPTQEGGLTLDLPEFAPGAW